MLTFVYVPLVNVPLVVHPVPVADGFELLVVTCHPVTPTPSLAVQSNELYVFLVTVTVGFVSSFQYAYKVESLATDLYKLFTNVPLAFIY